MKCNYSKACESKKPDGNGGYNCTASIKGYCGYQENNNVKKEPEPQKEIDNKTECKYPAERNSYMSQDDWIRKTKEMEMEGHKERSI